MWPRVPLTEKRGAASVTVAAEAVRFWISRLHGQAANDSAILKCTEAAAQKFNEGEKADAQRVLNSSGLTKLSPDGVALARAVAGSLGIAPLGMPWKEEPRL
jgi:hypothetical protein